MAWIKDGKVHKIVTGHMESTFHMNLEAHKKEVGKSRVILSEICTVYLA
jgi:hypothetical protein